MWLRIISSALILGASFMGFKQGWAMFSLKPEMLVLFRKWNICQTGLMANGVITILSAVLILFPKTFAWGNFIMAAGILLMICFHLHDKDLKSVAIESPFLLLNLTILYMQHPFKI